MNKPACELISDLLPLYADGVCSEESKKEVAKHISECEKCRKELEIMEKPVEVNVGNDIAVIKRIKRRMFIENVVTMIMISVFLLSVCNLGFLVVFSSDMPMGYYEYNLEENIRIEEDADGNLWFVRKDGAKKSAFLLPDVYDENGNRLSTDEDFDRERVVACSYQMRIMIHEKMSNIYTSGEEKELLFNKNDKPKIKTIYYYDEYNDENIVLWERGE